MSKQYIGAKLLKKIYIAEKQERILILISFLCVLMLFYYLCGENEKRGLLYIVLTFLLSVLNVTAGAQSMSNADSIQISLFDVFTW